MVPLTSQYYSVGKDMSTQAVVPSRQRGRHASSARHAHESCSHRVYERMGMPDVTSSLPSACFPVLLEIRIDNITP